MQSMLLDLDNMHSSYSNIINVLGLTIKYCSIKKKRCKMNLVEADSMETVKHICTRYIGAHVVEFHYPK